MPFTRDAQVSRVWIFRPPFWIFSKNRWPIFCRWSAPAGEWFGSIFYRKVINCLQKHYEIWRKGQQATFCILSNFSSYLLILRYRSSFYLLEIREVAKKLPCNFWKALPKFTFCGHGGRKQATPSFSFSLKTWVWSPRNQLQGNSPSYDIFSELDLALQSLKKLENEFILKVTFSLLSPS